MNKIKDPGLFKAIKSFLTVYLPKIRSKSPHTVQSYKSTLNAFIKFMKTAKGIHIHQLSIADFTPENILLFYEWLREHMKNSDSTRNQRLMCLRAFCRYLMGEDILSFETYSRIHEIKGVPVPERFLDASLSVDEVKHLLALPDASTKYGLRDRFYIALLYDTGCRNSEILDMDLGDIRFAKESGIASVMGKRKKPRLTPLSKEVTSMFNQYSDVFHMEKDLQKPIFYTSKKDGFARMSPDNTARILTKYEKEARIKFPNLPHLHPHLFRHTRAMHLYHAGMPLPLVGEWLGHSQLETTLIYANADAEMKRAAVEKISNTENTIFTDESFIFQDDEVTIKKLYGLT